MSFNVRYKVLNHRRFCGKIKHCSVAWVIREKNVFPWRNWQANPKQTHLVNRIVVCVYGGMQVMSHDGKCITPRHEYDVSLDNLMVQISPSGNHFIKCSILVVIITQRRTASTRAADPCWHSKWIYSPPLGFMHTLY